MLSVRSTSDQVSSSRNTLLQELFDQYVLLDPRPWPESLDNDVDADLWAEDTYLVGLVSSYLKSGRLSVDESVLDESIDSMLSHLVSTTGPMRRDMERFVRYRAKMQELAEALSAATGIPLGNGTRRA